MMSWRFGLACGLVLGGLALFAACGSDSADKDTSTDSGSTTGGTTDDSSDGADLTWTDDIKPIVDAHCLGSGCHGGDFSPKLSGSSAESTFKSNGKVATRLKAGDMPQIGSSQVSGFSSAKKTKLLNFLKQ